MGKAWFLASKITVFASGSAAGSMIRPAAAFAAGTALQTGDLDSPDFGPLFQIIPAELASEIRFQLVVERARIMVAGDQHRAASPKRSEHFEDARMTLARRDGADVDGWFRLCFFHCGGVLCRPPLVHSDAAAAGTGSELADPIPARAVTL